MPSSLPRRNSWVHSSLASPETAAFPRCQLGRLPHQVFRGLLNVHSCYGLHTRQVTDVTLYTEGFSPSLPVRLLRLLPAGAIVAGWDSHPLEDRAFARRTDNLTLNDRNHRLQVVYEFGRVFVFLAGRPDRLFTQRRTLTLGE